MGAPGIVHELAKDPLFQLSTAGQELFHTNLLYWLGAHRPAESREVWRALGLGADLFAADGNEVRREWRHIDLFVRRGGEHGAALVLENKVLAIAAPDQLVRYADDLRGHVDPLRTTFRLLSLMRPTFTLPEPWRLLEYGELVDPLRATAANLHGGEKILVEQYANLILKMVQLRNVFDPGEDLDRRVFLDEPTTSALAEARLGGLVIKMQMARCAELITARFSDLPGERAGAGFTRGQGLLEMYSPAAKGRQFGWQVQGVQFRLVGITGIRDPKKREGREALMASEHRDYFEEQPPEQLRLAPYVGKKVFLGYEPRFVYRYWTIPDSTTWSELRDLGEWASRKAYRYAQSTR